LKSSQKRMSAGWSFTAGALSGAAVVFVLLSSLHIPGLKAEASDQPRRGVVASAPSARTVASTVADAHPADPVVRPAPDSLRKAGQRSPAADRPSPRHSELDLQLD
jgi:hypothetical protein